MAVTYSSSLLGKYRSILSASAVSAATGATETVTLVHQLGASPHEIRVVVRSVTSMPSGCALFGVQSWNASQATIIMSAQPNLGAAQTVVDIIAELTHSLVQ